ncbi:ceramidase [Thalassotalea sp. M1531]|uniref:Ceramidase n=1 Tax=Thalassotalea algicola TaxID=2716224 RepID=A0A7Y0LAB6_9GAMM|nr:ceramidase domain-containing protein [Thalassotalea algicola]NMP30682.1 ceramidase [Thalassotalea algicola]
MEPTTSKRILLWCITIIAVISIGQIPPISQDLSYHAFADSHTYLGIPNMWNVISNIPFLFAGIYGVRFVLSAKQQLKSLYWGGLTFSIGILLVAFGSGYYHWQPNNETLVWDRLPMTIGFMGLYAMILSAFVRAESGIKLLPWLLVAGVVSVVYWVATETAGQGDLRWYALVQFLPMILTLVILLFFKSDEFNKTKLVGVLIWYSLAKLLEMGDFEILEITTIISGHSLKHVAAAIACFYVIEWLKTTKHRNS